jgi:hypothetical protein
LEQLRLTGYIQVFAGPSGRGVFCALKQSVEALLELYQKSTNGAAGIRGQERVKKLDLGQTMKLKSFWKCWRMVM